MSSGFGNIGDSFPETEVKCRVRGCKNYVHISGDEALKGIARGKNHPERMCDECYARLQTLEDKEMPCSKPGCNGTWIWSRYQQLEALASGRENQKPRGFCSECLEAMKKVEDIQVPCRMKGCKNTWTLTKRAQMELDGKPIPHKLCDECYNLLNSLTDKEVKCRIRGCDHTYVWNRFQQLEHIRSGKSLDNPPDKMCDSCYEIFKNLKPQEHKCRIRGCNNTWTYSTYEQLEQIVKAKSECHDGCTCCNGEEHEGEEHTEKSEKSEAGVPVPSRMCKECFDFYRNAVDKEVNCKNHFCKNTWTFTRSQQLSQKLTGRTGLPSRYCSECEAALKKLQDKEMPCMQAGCTGKWLYTKEDQLRDQTAGREPQPRRCRSCSEFLKSHPSIDVICEKCGKAIEVSNMQQLEIELKVSTLPVLCADCVQAQMKAELAGGDDTQNVISRPKIYIPKSGDWNDNAVTSNFPPALTPELIEKMGNGKVCVVCLGDEQSLAAGSGLLAWPAKLEQALADKVEGLAVYNAGLAGCTTAMNLKRFNRDVAPFKPQLVIASNVFADAMSLSLSAADAEIASFIAKLGEDVKALASAVEALGAKLLYLLPNGIYPADSDLYRTEPENASRRLAIFEQVFSGMRRACETAGIDTVDARAMFQMTGGDKVARKALEGWYLLNEGGAATVANWLKDEINQANLLGVSEAR